MSGDPASGASDGVSRMSAGCGMSVTEWTTFVMPPTGWRVPPEYPDRESNPDLHLERVATLAVGPPGLGTPRGTRTPARHLVRVLLCR
jgi:hypothetical protein